MPAAIRDIASPTYHQLLASGSERRSQPDDCLCALRLGEAPFQPAPASRRCRRRKKTRKGRGGGRCLYGQRRARPPQHGAVQATPPTLHACPISSSSPRSQRRVGAGRPPFGASRDAANGGHSPMKDDGGTSTLLAGLATGVARLAVERHREALGSDATETRTDLTPCL